MEPAGADDLTPIFPMSLISQEASPDSGGRDPGAGARRLASCGGRRRSSAPTASSARWYAARIYYKYEGGSPAGSHKPNSAVAQAYANKQAGSAGW